MLTKRAILDQVAQGELDAREAMRLLDALDERGTPDPQDAVRPVVRRLRIEAELGTVSIVGDPAVATVDVSGQHELSTEGDTTTIRCTPDPSAWGFVVLPFRSSDRRERSGDALIRVNPRLELDVAVAAGKVSIRGMPGPIRARVELGTLVVDDFTEPIDLTAEAGSIVARGRVDHGASTARCELGKIRLELDPGSSVTITGRAEVGAVALPGGVRIAGLATQTDASSRSVTVGAGSATLDVSAAAGKVEVLA